MNDQYISTEELNKKLDEAYNMGVEKCSKLVGGKYGEFLAVNFDKTHPELWALVSVTLFGLVQKIESLKKHS